MKTKDGKIIEILYKDRQGICSCDDGWKRLITDLQEPTLQEVKNKRKSAAKEK